MEEATEADDDDDEDVISGEIVADDDDDDKNEEEDNVDVDDDVDDDEEKEEVLLTAHKSPNAEDSSSECFPGDVLSSTSRESSLRSITSSVRSTGNRLVLLILLVPLRPNTDGTPSCPSPCPCPCPKVGGRLEGKEEDKTLNPVSSSHKSMA